MEIKKIIIAFVAILMAILQPWVFSSIYFAGLATPFPYLIVLILIPVDTKQVTMLCYGFTTGVLIDVIGGTPGLFTAALTLSAFLRKYLMLLFLDREIPMDTPPSTANLRSGFFLFLLLLVSIHLAALMLLDAFALFDLIYLLCRWGSSVLLTYVILVLLYFLLPMSRKKH